MRRSLTAALYDIFVGVIVLRFIKRGFGNTSLRYSTIKSSTVWKTNSPACMNPSDTCEAVECIDCSETGDSTECSDLRLESSMHQDAPFDKAPFDSLDASSSRTSRFAIGTGSRRSSFFHGVFQILHPRVIATGMAFSRCGRNGRCYRISPFYCTGRTYGQDWECECRR